MIIDDTHRAAFVHIPKCGGTSVSLQFAGVDSYLGAFRHKGHHPRLGPIHYAHIPLWCLERHFPAQFDKLSTYQCFALTRDPHVRFASALFQRLEEFRGVRKYDITAELALREARRVMGWLIGKARFCDLEYIHFSRQTDFVTLEGRPVVRNVFALEDIAAMAAAVEAAWGVGFDPHKRANTNFGSKNRLFAIVHAAKPIYSRLTTWALRERILLMMKRWNMQSPDALYADIRQDAEISAFVENYYSDDFTLHRAAMGRQRGACGASMAALATDQ